jgi:hypothetical protein
MSHPNDQDTSRLLPTAVAEQILTFGEFRMGAHRVALFLRDGTGFEPVIVGWGRKVVRVGDEPNDDPLPFDPALVVRAEDRAEVDYD